jgi:hypothetical protein
MPSYTERFTEMHQQAVALYPDSRAAAVYNTNWAACHTHHRFIVELLVGDMAQGATIDLALQEATDDTGTNAANIAGKAITQLTQAGGDGDDACVIEVRMEELTPGYDYVRAVLTIGGGACDTALIGLGVVARYQPVPTGGLTEIVD